MKIEIVLIEIVLWDRDQDGDWTITEQMQATDFLDAEGKLAIMRRHYETRMYQAEPIPDEETEATVDQVVGVGDEIEKEERSNLNLTYDER
jgi:hypothetical protein